MTGTIVRWSSATLRGLQLIGSVDDIMKSILPEQDCEDVQSSFTIVGHVGKLAYQ